MARECRLWTLGFILFLLPFNFVCYEKTLRKIVRNQSKMVQRPFSEDSGGNVVWKNISQAHESKDEMLMLPGYAQVKTLYHKMVRPKISTILSSVETGKSKSTYSRMRIAKNENLNPMEFRLARNTFHNLTSTLQIPTEESIIFQPQINTYKNTSYTGDVAISTYYQIPASSKFFPPVDDRDLHNVEQKINVKETTIVIPPSPETDHENNSLLHKGIFIADTVTNAEHNISSIQEVSKVSKDNPVSAENYQETDFLLEVVSADLAVNSRYKYNITDNPYTCTIVQELKVDIDSSVQFSKFDIEPSWIAKKHYWDNIFDSRYESLMRNSKWPPLQVILMPCSQVVSIWKQTFEQNHNNTVNKILSNIVKKLQYYKRLTFTWNEVSHLSYWWKRISLKSRMAFRKLLKSGRLEITTGGWVESEEGTAHLFGLLHQLIEGHQWLKNNLNYAPKVGWLANSVTHSPTIPYLLSASGITKFVITNVHYSWEQFFAEFQISDFVWVQSFDSDKTCTTTLNQDLERIGNDRYPKHSVLTHYLQFNSGSFKSCGPNKNICLEDFDFKKPNKNLDIHAYNVKQKSEKLLEQYSKTGTLSPHNVVIAPLGGPYRYELQTEFDYQYNNYQRLADFINVNKYIYTANMEFGTASTYFNAILSKHKSYSSFHGDFLNFADIKSGNPAYWSGFFTSRPLLKILLRRVQATMRSTEILLSFAVNFNVFPRHNVSGLFELLIKSRESLARLQDRHVVGGTLRSNIVQYVYKQILVTIQDCWHIQEVATSLLTSKPENRSIYLKKIVYREGEFISEYKTVSVGDQLYVFNSLSQERTEIVELISKQPNIRVVDHNKKDVTIQINPVWSLTPMNFIEISSTMYKILFAIVVPPMALELYKIKETYDVTHNIASIYCGRCVLDRESGKNPSFSFNLLPLQPGDVQLESYKHRVVIDELSGLLKTVFEKESNTEKNVLIDYGAFRSADVNSGIFLFNTNVTKPLQDILLPYRDGTMTKIAIIIAGPVATEMTTVFGRLLQHSIRLHNLINSPLANSIYIESKLDYELSPKNRELEIFLSIRTDINNGNDPEIFIDNNGFQYTPRTLNISRRIESNLYPFTSMAYIQDGKSRLTLITDHAQGITAFQEGQIVVVLDRRVLFNDGRGTHEGLADSSATYHRHYILLENFIDPSNQNKELYRTELKLPSFAAAFLADSLNYILDLFVVDKQAAGLSYYKFLPLIKTSFPCDIAVINFRTVVNKLSRQFLVPSIALLVMHRHSVSCHIKNPPSHCDGDSRFSLENIFRNIKSCMSTNLVGTEDGTLLTNINKDKFPPMELMTVKIFF